MPKTIIHIGANKTGSTTLQRCLFSRSPRFSYLGEDCANYPEYRDVLNSLVSDDDIHFCYANAQRIFHDVLSPRHDKTAIYSNEDIMASRVPTLCAQRLYRLLPHAEILVVVRNQLTAIESWYVNHGAYLKHVPRSYWRQYVSFDDWMTYCTEFIKYSPLDSYFYYRILHIYASLFGRERIHVLLYEDFVGNHEAFINLLTSILEIEASEAAALLKEKRERPRKTMRMHRCDRLLGCFLRGRLLSDLLPGTTLPRVCQRFMEGGSAANGFVSDYWHLRIQELFHDDNTKLANEYNLLLHEHGYP